MPPRWPRNSNACVRPNCCCPKTSAASRPGQTRRAAAAAAALAFRMEAARRLLTAQFGTRDLAGFGAADLTVGLRAAGALLQYAQDTQKAALPHIRALAVQARDEGLQLDAATRRNLELDRGLSGNDDATLFALLNRTATAMGSRELRRWLNRPLRDRAVLRQRHAAVGLLGESRDFAGVADALAPIGDVERILARVALRSARPRDLVQLRASIGALPRLRALVAAFDAPLLKALHARIGVHGEEHALLARAIAEEPSAILRDGDVIATGFDAGLDQLRRIATNTDEFLLELEKKERERSCAAETGLQPRAGVLHRDSRAHAERVPADYLRRQTVKSAERFITPELKSFEDEVLGARDKALARVLLLELEQELVGVRGDAPQLVELRVEAGGDHIAVAQDRRGFFGDRARPAARALRRARRCANAGPSAAARRTRRPAYAGGAARLATRAAAPGRAVAPTAAPRAPGSAPHRRSARARRPRPRRHATRPAAPPPHGAGAAPRDRAAGGSASAAARASPSPWRCGSAARTAWRHHCPKGRGPVPGCGAWPHPAADLRRAPALQRADMRQCRLLRVLCVLQQRAGGAQAHGESTEACQVARAELRREQAP